MQHVLCYAVMGLGARLPKIKSLAFWLCKPQALAVDTVRRENFEAQNLCEFRNRQ